ncbi:MULTISPECIES: protein-disulfide reductase DsbD [Colwellia]|uniref:Thiol:disulfide interchange protein DsbD n=1 Tax=Colwellia marinimaniae TaxID=1513592 RepID=A0ABQ0MXJ6_9GAMM|nr:MULTISPECIES: protein-disulfide reductase DsbD [Colwellia]GAW97099.1 thiol:disulfide interchange protein [Colwellia marinimaniae]
MLKNIIQSSLFLCLIFVTHITLAVNEADLLPANKAFKFSTSFKAPNILIAQWDIADGYYLYKKRIKISADKTSSSLSAVTVAAGVFPESTRLTDASYGDVEVFRNKITVQFPMIGKPSDIEHARLKVRYQGCADVGVCYTPIKSHIAIKDLLSELGQVSDEKELEVKNINSSSGKPAILLSEQDTIAASLSADNYFLTLLSFFGFGLLLAFTPCVFPMIPILSGIIIGQGKVLSTRRAFSLSLTYVLAMALTYTVVGILAALFGTNLQIWFQNPWILSSFAAVFVLLSLSMFGFYELQMPASIQEKLNNISNKQESGKLASAGIMGILSALIVGPCVTAPLIGALIYIGQTGNVLLGGSALFALGLGMGAPLLVIGTSAGKIMPKAGAWMVAVKSAFGVMMIAVAIWLLARILPPLVTQFLWALLLIFSGIYLGACLQHSKETSPWQLFWKSCGFVFILVGSLLIIGVASGTNNLLAPLKAFTGGGNVAQNISHKGINFTTIKSLDDLDIALATASQNNQTVMLDFYADWCIACIEMEETTFTDSKVKKALNNTITLQADVTENDEIDAALLAHFNILGPPAILFFNDKGEEQKGYRTVGYTAADKFYAHVLKAVNNN